MTPTSRALDPALVEELRGRLMEARAQLLRTIAVTDDELATLETHQPGAPIENVTREEVLTLLSRMGDREKHELDEIHAAWLRLEGGTFGVCEGCGAPLSPARLRAVPTAQYCVDCQGEMERRAR